MKPLPLDLQHPKVAASQKVFVLFVCFAIQVAGQALREYQEYSSYWSPHSMSPNVTHLSKL